MTLSARNRIVCAGLMAVPLAVLIGHSLYFNFVCDDAFIFFRYADNLLRHGELNFNPGQRVEGYTSFLWTVLIAAGMALGSEPITWSLGLGLICGCATLVAVQRLGATLDGLVEPEQPRGAIRLWRFVAPALLSATPAFACWTSGGLETALFTLLVTAAFWRYWAEPATPSGTPWSGLLFGLACLTRPEGFLFFGLTLLHRLVDQGLRCSRRRPARRDWIWLALFLLPVLPHQLWRISYYGQVLPNTYYARVAGLDHQGRGLLYLQMFVGQYGLWIILLLLVVPRARPGGRSVTSFYTHLAALVLVLMVYVSGVGGDFMALHRFLVPVTPLLALVLADELRNLHVLVRSLRARHGAGLLALHAVEAVLAAGIVLHCASLSRHGMETSSAAGVDQIGYLKRFTVENTAIGRWLAQHADPEARIATTAAGAIPFYSRLRAYDMYGLTEPAVAQDRSASRSRPGHAHMATAEEVVAWGPTHVIGHPRVYTHASEGPQAERARWERRGYRWRIVPLPELQRWWGFFERTDPPAG